MLGIKGRDLDGQQNRLLASILFLFFPFPATTDAVSEVHEKNSGFFSPLNAFRGP